MTDALRALWIDDAQLPELAQTKQGTAVSPVARARALLAQQRRDWGLAQRGYDSLSQVRVRRLEVDGYPVRLQWNPGRRRSSSAKVDARSIEARPCFLCAAHLPEGQRAVPFLEAYALLVNPFPIAPEHFTVPALRHRPQQIAGTLCDLLSLARDLSPRYTAFYNGPRCGASAPDHLHFQAIPSGYMPLDADFSALCATHGEVAGEARGVCIWRLDRLPCRCIALEAEQMGPLATAAEALLTGLSGGPGDDEPMLNLAARYVDGWRLTVIPRARHRPSFYAQEGTEGFLLSPATVDLGGVCITPREEDFDRLTVDDLRVMFDEVCAPAATVRQAAASLAADLEKGGVL